MGFRRSQVRILSPRHVRPAVATSYGGPSDFGSTVFWAVLLRCYPCKIFWKPARNRHEKLPGWARSPAWTPTLAHVWPVVAVEQMANPVRRGPVGWPRGRRVGTTFPVLSPMPVDLPLLFSYPFFSGISRVISLYNSCPMRALGNSLGNSAPSMHRCST